MLFAPGNYVAEQFVRMQTTARARFCLCSLFNARYFAVAYIRTDELRPIHRSGTGRKIPP